MAVLDRQVFGIVVLLLWAMLVLVKKFATGSLLGDKPAGGVGIWLVHIFNFSFLLVGNPVAAGLLILGRTDTTKSSAESAVIGTAGMLIAAAGYIVMGWSLLTLRRNYQVGGNAPRKSDKLFISGPYRIIRHPMYASAVCVALGLACLTRHPAFLLVFCTYVAIVLLLIPFEERALLRVYGGAYAAYQQRVKRLIPLLY